MHSADLGNPAMLVKALDPAGMRPLFAMVGEGERCLRHGVGSAFGLAAEPAGCSEMDLLGPHRGKDGLLGKLAESAAQKTYGLYKWPDGTFRSAAPPDIQLAEVREARCYQTESYAAGDRGLYAVTHEPRSRDDISLPGYLAHTDAAARSVALASPAERDPRLLEYFEVRKTMGFVIHRFFGDPGLQLAAAHNGGPEHQAAIALLRQRLADPGFASALNPVERAELELLAADPLDFVSCTARRAQGKA
jgi:hypothetical protein